MTLHPSPADRHPLSLRADRRTAQRRAADEQQGQLLDGTDSGKPGSNYRAPLTWRNLVLDPPAPKTRHVVRQGCHDASVKLKPKPAAHPDIHKSKPFARLRTFRR